MLGNQVWCVQFGDTAVLHRRTGEVWTAERQQRLRMAARQAAQRLLEEAGLDGVVEEGLYLALAEGRCGDFALES